jgi:hypothetical protein
MDPHAVQYHPAQTQSVPRITEVEDMEAPVQPRGRGSKAQRKKSRPTPGTLPRVEPKSDSPERVKSTPRVALDFIYFCFTGAQANQKLHLQKARGLFRRRRRG